jgi:hypothetical protein
VRTTVKQSIVLTEGRRYDLLASALNLSSGSTYPSRAQMGVSLDIVRFLLEYYTDLNRRGISGVSLWEMFLKSLREEREIFGLEHCELVELVAVMVSAGARLKDATADCTRWMRNHLFSPEDWEYILNSQPQKVAKSASSSLPPIAEGQTGERARQKGEGKRGARGPKSLNEGVSSAPWVILERGRKRRAR